VKLAAPPAGVCCPQRVDCRADATRAMQQHALALGGDAGQRAGILAGASFEAAENQHHMLPQLLKGEERDSALVPCAAAGVR